jgi:hypothetical protein
MSPTSSPSPAKPKITISFDDLHTPQVENRLRQQAALSGAVANQQRAAITPSLLPMAGSERTSLWRGAFFNLFIFGLLGGLLAWACGEAVEYFNPDLQTQARQLEQSMLDIRYVGQKGRVDPKRLDRDLAFIKEQGRDNPWFQIAIDTKMTDAEKAVRTNELKVRDQLRRGFADVCFYAACGMMLAISLGMAESVATRNWRGAVVYGGVGAVLGLLGGVSALVANALYQAFGGGQSADHASFAIQVAARSAGWGLLGVFLSAAPGLVMRNWRKLCLGVLGGLIGGIIGGALFDPVAQFTKDPMLSRFIAIVAIGVITGVGTALVENVAKQGWLKVVQGLIAGKQFIVYRNPTFIGSSPACEIYLFKDPQVGPRHAAIHVFDVGYQIEDLGVGGRTLVNGRPVRRARLRSGDRIQIGSTAFTFHERARKTD